MKKADRIRALSWLGSNIFQLNGMDDAIRKAELANPFFTEEFCRLALGSISGWMQEEVLSEWLAGVPEENSAPKAIGLIMAGNLPLVGWHDILSVFATGNHCRYKPSAQDEVLPEFLLDALAAEFPDSAVFFEKAVQMKGIDALIATGSNATATHFDFYFRNIPRLIRGARSSLGIIYGFESSDELLPLCDDIMQYFGMGCRSITKILVPEGYDFTPFFNALEKYRYLTDHYRFQNNAIYHKAIFLMNGDPFLENDMLVVRKYDRLFSPPGVLNYQEYSSLEQAREMAASHQSEIQCMVSHNGQFPGSLPFGSAQKPGISDYADGVNTLEFLTSLHH